MGRAGNTEQPLLARRSFQAALPLLASTEPLPAAPPVGTSVDWRELENALPWLPALAGTPQDPLFHAEGDVYRHTQMVVEQLLDDPAWQQLDEETRDELFWAALLHDIGKPATTKHEDGRITSRGHSLKGAVIARGILWRAALDPDRRERVCALVRHHMAPGFLLDNADPLRRAALISVSTKASELALLARADARGRIAPNLAESLEAIDLFEAFCDENGCLDNPYPFASDHARFVYFRREDRDPSYAAYDDTRCEVTVLSGLPASGKDTWAATEGEDRPVIALDLIRAEFGVSPRKDQGVVVQAARERAREYLRQGQDFIWNATALSRRTRGQTIQLAADYNARVRIVSVETDVESLLERNKARPGEARVPDDALLGMLDKWEAPDLSECHTLERSLS